jgi:hypothetical protein
VIATLLNGVITTAGIVATGAEVGAVAGPPGIVIGAVVALLTVAVYTFGGSVLIDYAAQFNDVTLRENMVLAMYAAENADEGYSAFKTTLLANMDTIPAEIIYTLWWSAWSNDVYSGSPEVDDSAFDGSICGPSCDLLYTDVYSGDPVDVTSSAFTGYTSYIVENDPTTGEITLHVEINTVLEHTWAGNFVQEFSAFETDEIVLTYESIAPAGGTVTLQGCPAL